MSEIGWTEYEQVMLALCLWREARGETIECQEWIAWTVRNRCRKGWWNPSGTLIGAIIHPYQYSSITDPADRQLIKFPTLSKHNGDWIPDQAMMQIFYVVNQVMMMPDDMAPTDSDSYYDDSIDPPAWAVPENARGKIGRISFFKVLM